MGSAVRTAKQRKLIEEGNYEALKDLMSVRERRFCEEYVIDFNATAACRRAGYNSPKYLDRFGTIMLARPHIKYYVEFLTQSKEAKITAVDPDYIVGKILTIVNKEGARDGDKLRGLELLARHLGMLRDKTEISGPDGEAIQMEQRTAENSAAVIAALKSIKTKKLRVVGGTDTDEP